MKVLYQILNGTGYCYIADGDGNEVPETAGYQDLDWARIDLMKLAADYFFAAKEKAEENCEPMDFNNIEIVDNKAILR